MQEALYWYTDVYVFTERIEKNLKERMFSVGNRVDKVPPFPTSMAYKTADNTDTRAEDDGRRNSRRVADSTGPPAQEEEGEKQTAIDSQADMDTRKCIIKLCGYFS